MIIKTKNAEFNSESIFTPIDIVTRRTEVEKQLHESVYVSDNWEDLLESIENEYTLWLGTFSTNPREVAPYITTDGSEWTFCLPASAVTFIKPEKEVTYRPFKTIDELLEKLNVDFGSFITWRYKNQKNHIYKEMITGIKTIKTDDDEIFTLVCLANMFWSTENLFKQMEYQDANGEWCVFGIKETKG